MRVLFGHNKDQGGHFLAGHGLSSGGALAAYAVAGVLPSYVMDTENGIYYDGTYYDGPNQLHDHATTSRRTVVDSDGLIKWAPHNIALNSASPATQSITVVSGADYTVAVRGSGSMTLSNAGTGTATDGSPVEITASTTTLTITLTGSLDKVWVYRSDLGGMQSTGDATDPTYVPTEGSAVYWMGTDHDPVTGEALGVQGEPAATNRTTYSNDFTNVVWLKENVTLNSGFADSPLGTNTATKITPTTTTGGHRVYNGATASSGDRGRSIFVKPDGYSQVALRESSSTGAAAVFTLTGDGVVDGTHSSGNVSVSLAEIEAFPDGWYRLIFETTDAATTPQTLGFHVLDGSWTSGDPSSISFAGDGTSNVLIAGVQDEADNVTSYIPTSGATATRAAPNVTKPTSEISANLDELLVVAEWQSTATDADAVIAALDNAGTDLIHLRAHADNANLFVQDGGVTQADVDAGAISADVNYRAAFKIAADDFAASLAGATAVTDTSGTMPTPTTLRLFNSNGAAALAGIRLKKLIVYAGAAGALDAIDATALEGAAA